MKKTIEDIFIPLGKKPRPQKHGPLDPLSTIQIFTEPGGIVVTGLAEGQNMDMILRGTLKRKAIYFVIVYRPGREYPQCHGLLIGKAGNLREAAVKCLIKQRDGGTTDVEYRYNGKKGRLHIPTPFKPEQKPTNTHPDLEFPYRNLVRLEIPQQPVTRSSLRRLRGVAENETTVKIARP
jgi:hypothetical protein